LGVHDLSVEVEDLEADFPPVVVMIDGFTDGGDFGVGELPHLGFVVDLDGEIPIRAVAAVGMATASLMKIANEAPPEEILDWGQCSDELVASGGEFFDVWDGVGHRGLLDYCL
jgi:hypothetical protein